MFFLYFARFLTYNQVFRSDEATYYTVCQEGLYLSLHLVSYCLPITLTFSGKTSLIHSLAGELGLDIYVVSLSSKG
jgi:hypothetical protein